MVELKINALNQLKILKQSTFKDTLCFLDEDIQNAQRAKASIVKVHTDMSDSILTIFNDGEVLDDPQKLFSIAESGWEAEDVKSENPFGIGFFSNISVSNFIVIRTGDKIITFDVDKMLNDGETEVDVAESDEYVDGFELSLHNFDFYTVSRYDIHERLQLLSNFIHELDIEFDNKILKHIPLTECDNSNEHWVSIENDMCKGWIGVSSNWSWSDELNIYYKGRFVTNLPSTPYVSGKLHINDNVLNLVAPDRKDIMRDEKLTAFREMVIDEMRKLCNKLITDNVDMSDISTCVKKYCDKDDIVNNISFITFNTHDDNAMSYLEGFAIASENDDSIKSLEDYEVMLKNKDVNNEMYEDEEIKVSDDYDVDEDLKKYKDENKESRDFKSYDTENKDKNKDKNENPLAVIGESEENITNIAGELIKNSKEPVFYLKYSEVGSLKRKLAIARHYNLRIIIARNEVEYSILENLSDSECDMPVMRIESLIEDVEVHGTIKNTKLTAKEKRADSLFGMISEMFDCDENVFVIGDLDVVKEIAIKSIGVSKTYEDNDVNILYSEKHDKIFIDRKIIKDKKLTSNLSTKLNISDMQFILANIENISIAMVSYNNQSCDASLYDIRDVQSTIIDLLSRYEPSNQMPKAEKSLTRKQKKRKHMLEKSNKN